MRTKWLWLLVVGLMAGWLSPCFAQFEPETMEQGLLPTAYYESAAQKIKVGETTEADVRGLLGNPHNTIPAGPDKKFCFGPLPKSAGEAEKYAMEITINSGKVSKVTTNLPK